MSDSHLLLSWAGSGCCDTTPDIGHTQLRLSLLRGESPAAVLPPPLVLLDNDPLFADHLETALRVGQSRAGFWGKLGNLLCLLPPLPRDITVSCAQGGLSAATHSSVSHHGPREKREGARVGILYLLCRCSVFVVYICRVMGETVGWRGVGYSAVFESASHQAQVVESSLVQRYTAVFESASHQAQVVESSLVQRYTSRGRAWTGQIGIWRS